MNDNKNETKQPRKKTESAADKNQPVKVIRHGAIAASIWQRQAQSGYEYYDFTISRSWASVSGDKKGYSQNFFEANREAIVSCVEEASAWIASQKSSEDASGESIAA
jgi:hypothetical protein